MNSGDVIRCTAGCARSKQRATGLTSGRRELAHKAEREQVDYGSSNPARRG